MVTITQTKTFRLGTITLATFTKKEYNGNIHYSIALGDNNLNSTQRIINNLELFSIALTITTIAMALCK